MTSRLRMHAVRTLQKHLNFLTLVRTVALRIRRQLVWRETPSTPNVRRSADSTALSPMTELVWLWLNLQMDLRMIQIGQPQLTSSIQWLRLNHAPDPVNP